MGNYFDLIAAINAAIKTNGEQGITGASLNAILRDMVAALGAGYQYVGVVTPDAAAPSTDYNAVYLGLTAGTYTNFGGTQVRGGQFGVFTFNGSWTYNVADIASGGYVRYDASQVMTQEQAAQARSNIAAASNADVNAKYTKPSVGIPKTDLVFAVQTSLDKADVAAGVTRRSLEETGVAFYISGESFIVFATNDEYVEVYFIECGDDNTNVRVTMLSEPDAELGPLVDFYPYDGKLLVWPNDAIDLSVIRLREPGPVVFTNVADKSGADPKIEPGLFVRKDLLDVLLAEKANVDGYYERLTAGGAERLIAPSNVSDSSLEQTTGGDAEVANGLARINEVKGKSQVWNQLADINAWTTPSGTASGITFTRNYAEGSISVSGTATADAISNAATKPSVIAGHKYYIRGGDINRGYCINVYDPTHFGAVSRNAPTIVTALASGTLDNFRALVLSGKSVNGEKMYPGFIDLTLLGIDNLTTPEQVEDWLAKNKGLKLYYPHDDGSILNSKLIGLESYGRNLLNPSTNKARIIGRYSDTYGNYYGITGTYDSISFTSDLGETTTITPDSDGKFVLTEPGVLDVVNPGADCAVFIWWDGKKTDYTPYKTDKAYIDLTHIYGKLNGTGELVQVFPDGGRGVNDVKDRLYVEDGVVKAKVAMGKVDLGSQNWGFNSNVFSIYGLDKAIGSNIVCPRYQTSLNTAFSTQNNRISGSSTDVYKSWIFIKDTAYSDAASFKTAMSGVPLIYELATPLIYTDLVYQGSSHFEDGTPVTLPVDYEVDNYGMEVQLLGSDSVPAELSIRYQMDAAEAIDTLQTEMAEVQETIAPDNIITAASMDNFLSALGTAMEGTWTKTWNSTTNKYDFTFTPNS